MNRLAADDAINVMGLAKGCERYVVLFPDTERANVVIALRDWSVNPELDFDADDANRVLLKMRQDADYRMECEKK